MNTLSDIETATMNQLQGAAEDNIQDLIPSSEEEVNGAVEISKLINDRDRVRTILDIGAYNYYHSICFTRLFPNAVVHAFEADPSNFASFAHVHNDNIRIVKRNIALADKVCKMWFNTSRGPQLTGWGVAGSLLEPTDFMLDNQPGVKDGSFQFNHKLTVDVTTIEQYCKDNYIKNIDMIHVDVQGAEIYVMRGLGEYRPKYIFAETCEHDHYKGSLTKEDLDNELKDKGYKIIREFSTDTLYEYDR